MEQTTTTTQPIKTTTTTGPTTTAIEGTTTTTATSTTSQPKTTTTKPLTSARLDEYCERVTAYPCQNNGKCISVNTNEYYCTCGTLFTGRHCETIISSGLYSYGFSEGDRCFTRSDDGLVYLGLPTRFRFFKYLCKYLYISMNGYVTCNERFSDLSPNSFPMWWRPKLSIVAPFWGDWDCSGSWSCSDGCGVYYRTLDKLVDTTNPTASNEDPEKLALDAKRQYIFTRAQAHAELRDAEFDVSTIIIITWYKMRPHWYWWHSDEQSSTFQLVILVDGLRQRAMALYLYDNLVWNFRRVSIGYQTYTGLISTPGSIYNHPFSFSRTAFDLHVMNGNTGETITWIYPLYDPSSPVDVNYGQLCKNWANSQPWTVVSQLWMLRWWAPSCPCNEWWIWWDWRFSYHWQTRCYYTSVPFFFGSYGSVECCYNNWGWLITTTNQGASGTYQLYNPFWFSMAWNQLDRTPKDNCCVFSDYCYLYYRFRPRTTCFWWRSFWFLWFWGDPHIATVDGLKYTFNGLGEYWMIKSENLTMQARTVLAKNDTGHYVNATIFGGFVMRKRGSETIQVLLQEPDRTNFSVTSDSEDLTNWYYDDTSANSTLVGSVVLQKNLTAHQLVVVFTNPDSSIEIVLKSKQLTVSVSLPDSLQEKISGLLGNFNGNSSDDLMAPDKTVIPETSSEEDIFYKFGELWRTTAQTSIFIYNASDGETHEKFNDKTFVPVFVPKLTDLPKDKQDMILNKCGNNTQCQYDYLLTGSEEVAQNTLITEASKDSERKIQGTEPPDLYVQEVVNVTGGDLLVLTLRATHPRASGTVNITYVIPEDANFTYTSGPAAVTTANVTWQAPLTLDFPANFSFAAVIGDGVTSAEIVVQIYFCQCIHGQCDFSRMQDGYDETMSFIRVVCDCDDEYTGDYCNTDRDACADNPCSSGTNCTDLAAEESQALGRGYNCSECPQGFTQDEQSMKCRDINECNTTNSCGIHTCQNTPGTYECVCLSGYRKNDTGHCENVDECHLGTAMCEQECTDNEGSFNCSCLVGFSLAGDKVTCVQDLVPPAGCELLNCSYGCTLNGSDPLCFCQSGEELDADDESCIDIDECGGANECGPNAECNNLTPGYNCSCKDGYLLDDNKRTCTKCERKWGPDCKMFCTCKDLNTKCNSTYGCEECAPGFEGGDCSEDIDECANGAAATCGDYANCTNTIGSYSCRCIPGYKKDNGSCVEFDACESFPCKNGANCTDMLVGYNCTCLSGFQGKQCQIDLDECASNPCVNNGTCTDQPGYFSCFCPEGYKGLFCELAVIPLPTTMAVSPMMTTAQLNASAGTDITTISTFTVTAQGDEVTSTSPAETSRTGSRTPLPTTTEEYSTSIEPSTRATVSTTSRIAPLPTTTEEYSTSIEPSTRATESGTSKIGDQVSTTTPAGASVTGATSDGVTKTAEISTSAPTSTETWHLTLDINNLTYTDADYGNADKPKAKELIAILEKAVRTALSEENPDLASLIIRLHKFTFSDTGGKLGVKCEIEVGDAELIPIPVVGEKLEQKLKEDNIDGKLISLCKKLEGCHRDESYNVHVDFKIFNEPYITELSNTSSQEYGNLSTRIYKVVVPVLKKEHKVFLDVSSILFSNGSIRVKMDVSLSSTEGISLKDIGNNIMNALVNAGYNATLENACSGNYQTLCEDLVLVPEDINVPLLAGLLGAIVALIMLVAGAILAVWLVRYRRRKALASSDSSSSSSDTSSSYSDKSSKVINFALPRPQAYHWHHDYDVGRMDASPGILYGRQQPPGLANGHQSVDSSAVNWQVLRAFSGQADPALHRHPVRNVWQDTDIPSAADFYSTAERNNAHLAPVPRWRWSES